MIPVAGRVRIGAVVCGASFLPPGVLSLSVLQELKQRRIVQFVASYAVSGWVALEVVGALVERGIFPEVTYRVGLVLYLGGLLATVILGWFHGEKGRQQASPFELSLLVAIAVGTGYFGYQTVREAQADSLANTLGTSGSMDLRRVGVLYFTDLTRTGELGYLADGLTESLITRLDEVAGLDLISESGSARFRDSDLPRDSIAALLSAGTLVDATVETRGDDVRVNLLLVDGESGAELQRATLDRPADDIFALQDDLAEEVAGLLRGWLGQEVSVRRARAGTESVPAWVAYQRGLQAEKDGGQRREAGDDEGFTLEYSRADSLFTVASEADPKWSRPIMMKASLASQQGEHWIFEDQEQAEDWIDLGIDFANAAIEQDPRNGSSYQVRGELMYLRWAYGFVTTRAESEQAFRGAMDDLQEAVRIDPGLAKAWSLLSVLHSQEPDLVEANLAARRALEADEFLRSAGSVLRTLYATSYDLENFQDAARYCEEGGRRFPDVATFTECRLWLMATRSGDHDPELAWATLEEHLGMIPEAERERERLVGQLVVANVLARANLPDSALSVVARSQASPELDPTRELLGLEALVYIALGDPDAAVERLKVYLTASPQHREGWRWTSHWWWRSLQDHAEFRRLIG